MPTEYQIGHSCSRPRRRQVCEQAITALCASAEAEESTSGVEDLEDLTWREESISHEINAEQDQVLGWGGVGVW